MIPSLERRERRGTRHVLLTGMGVVLALLFALGLYAARSLSSVSRAGTLTTHDYLQQSERLDRVHLYLNAAAGAVRDYLLDSDPLSLPAHREEAKRSWAQAVRAIDGYKKVAASERGPLIRQLDTQIAAYWAIASPSLEMTEQRRTESAIQLLLGDLIPLREACLTTLGEIASRDRAGLQAAASGTAQFVRGAERRLWAAIALIVGFSVLVSWTTVRYLVRLENTALAQYEGSVRAGAELQRLSRRLMTLQEDERRKIARELHDDYGQRMAAVLFELSAAAERADTAPELHLSLQTIGERLTGLAKDLQQLSRSLHSAVLDKIGLEAAIRSDCNALRQRTGWEVEFHAVGVPRRLPEPVSLAAYRVFQEGLQNAMKHSHTTRLQVRLSAEGGNLMLQVTDSGVGFDTERASQTGGLGLLSMRERVEMIGGTLRIRSEAGRGTQVEAMFPVAAYDSSQLPAQR
ncbi:MAG TPA: ATP-binding protein [Bryobacteraceae bacterium]|nr:ATP-binding protein [Bryobacteraceae bacterium]